MSTTHIDRILFDLDGTISDPSIGIFRSIDYALESCGCEPIENSIITKYIGIPLDRIFTELAGDRIEIEQLVKRYRQRYWEIGYTENVLYPDIVEVLNELNTIDLPMAICTSKRQDIAAKILDLFGIGHYFQFISGGDVGVTKSQQIAKLKSQGKVSNSSVTIGDRSVDLIAAHRNGLRSGGVLWGFGDRSELEREAPFYLFASPSELIRLADEFDVTDRDRSSLTGCQG